MENNLLVVGGSNTTAPQFRNSKGKLDTYSLAEYIEEQYHVIILDGMLYIYVDGIYVHDEQLIDNIITKLARGAKPSEKKSVRDNLMADIYSKDNGNPKKQSDYYYVAFNNCIVDIRSLETFDFDPDEFVITSKVYADYNAESDEATIQLVDSFFNTICCGNTELENLLFEIIGYCMIRSAKYQRAFILYGNANNGKSDYMNIISELLGRYCTHQNLIQLSNLNNLRSVFQCTANVIDDVEDISKVDFSKIRTLISGNGKFAIRSAGNTEFSFKPYATLILGTTHILNFSGCDDETIRRFKVVPFEAKFNKDTVDRNMTEMITSSSSLNLIATRAIQAVSRLGREWEFPTVVEKQTDMYFFEGNPVLAFGKLYPIKRIITIDDYYKKYCIWYLHTFNVECDINIAVFGKRLNALFGIESVPHTIDGVRDTFYQAHDFNLELCKKQCDEYCKSTGKSMKLLEYVDYLNKLDEQDNQ